MRKKAQAFADQAIYAILVLVFIVVFVLAGFIMVQFNSIFSGSEIFEENETLQDLRGDALETAIAFDISVVTIVLGLGVVIFLSAFFFQNAPFFFGFFLMLTFIFMLISFPLVNGIYDLVNDTVFAETIALMPATIFFINNWAWVVVSYVVFVIVGFGAKARIGDGGSGL